MWATVYRRFFSQGRGAFFGIPGLTRVFSGFQRQYCCVVIAVVGGNIVAIGRVGGARGTILRCVGSAVNRHNITPSIHRVNRTIKLHSASSIRCGLGTLRRTKCVRESPGLGHAVELDNDGLGTAPIPLLNAITTNVPVLTRRVVRRCVPITLGGNKRFFTLRIGNSSVVGTRVRDNSVVVIRGAPITGGNSVIITLVNSRTAIGECCGRGKRFHLRPRGSSCRPVVISRLILLNGIISLVHGCWDNAGAPFCARC